MRRLLLILVGALVLCPTAQAQDKVLTTHGYFDLEYQQSNKDEEGKRGTFDQHHFNVINSFILDEHFRVLGEIEWEHGLDFNDGGMAGEIRLERAWVEYKYTDALKVRAGKFLTPYGIYNLIHDATPTFLSTFLPSSIYSKHRNPLGEKQRLYAKFSNGLQVLGTVFLKQWRLEYAAYLSNGQGLNAFEQDDNADKAFGGRLLIAVPFHKLVLGTSFYTEKNGAAGHTRQASLAFDVEYGVGAWHITGEAALGRLEQVDDAAAPMGVYQKTLGLYAQTAYTLFDRFTPFARYDYFDPGTTQAGDAEGDLTVGLNISATARVYLKGEVHFLHFQDNHSGSYELFVASIAVAF